MDASAEERRLINMLSSLFSFLSTSMLMFFGSHIYVLLTGRAAYFPSGFRRLSIKNL